MSTTGRRTAPSLCSSLFSAADVLTLPSCRFSDGNLGAAANVGSDFEFLSELDFRKIYSTGAHEPGDRAITFSRSAEVIVKGELNLAALKQVVTRTIAERATLISLLDAVTLRKWGRVISVDNGLDLFERKYNFVEDVDLAGHVATLNFSPDSCATGPFDAKIAIVDLGTGRRYRYEEEAFSCPPQFKLGLPAQLGSYRLSVRLDGHLAYRGDYFSELPF